MRLFAFCKTSIFQFLKRKYSRVKLRAYISNLSTYLRKIPEKNEGIEPLFNPQAAQSLGFVSCTTYCCCNGGHFEYLNIQCV